MKETFEKVKIKLFLGGCKWLQNAECRLLIFASIVGRIFPVSDLNYVNLFIYIHIKKLSDPEHSAIKFGKRY